MDRFSKQLLVDFLLVAMVPSMALAVTLGEYEKASSDPAKQSQMLKMPMEQLSPGRHRYQIINVPRWQAKDTGAHRERSQIGSTGQ